MATLRETYKAVFGEDYTQEQYKYEPHSFDNNRRAGGKMYCRFCGLVALNNEFSQWSVRKGCLSDLHPEYKRMRKG